MRLAMRQTSLLRQSGFTDSAVMALQFLDFDQSEDAHGTKDWDALASPAPVHNAALLAEVACLLAGLCAQHGQPGPLDEGHAWDCDLQVHHEDGTPLAWHWHEHQVQWSSAAAPASARTRLTLSLCLTGGIDFGHTLEQEITAL